MNEWLKTILQVILLLVIVAMIAVSVNMLVEMRFLQMRIERLDFPFKENHHNRI